MTKALEFADLLRLIGERSTTFRAAIAAAPDLGARVPSCPEWSLLDLAHHIGRGQRRWAAVVAAGPATAPPPGFRDTPQAPGDRDTRQALDGPDNPEMPDDRDTAETPGDRDTLLAWLTDSTGELLGALREAGPDRGCWTWWGGSESPQTAGSVARHQLQEVAVHTYDAQLTVGNPQPLPADVALDGVDEFLATCCAGPYRWPHRPAVVGYEATEGGSWRLSLAADGVRVTRPTEPGAPAAATLQATAGELVLALYGRIPIGSLKLDGDREIFDQLLAWDPEE